jgi:hypothetical protein
MTFWLILLKQKSLMVNFGTRMTNQRRGWPRLISVDNPSWQNVVAVCCPPPPMSRCIPNIQLYLLLTWAQAPEQFGASIIIQIIIEIEEAMWRCECCHTVLLIDSERDNVRPLLVGEDRSKLGLLFDLDGSVLFEVGWVYRQLTNESLAKL